MVTFETAAAAIITFLLGMAFGFFVWWKILTYLPRYPYGRKMLRHLCDKMEQLYKDVEDPDNFVKPDIPENQR
jgi:hypothetical protein